jgi:hypothetical protein
MSAPAPVPVAISVRANLEADRVIYQFGDQSYSLSIEDAAVLVNHTLTAMEILRPAAAPTVVPKLLALNRVPTLVRQLWSDLW